jgi:hypothetical protein
MLTVPYNRGPLHQNQATGGLNYLHQVRLPWMWELKDSKAEKSSIQFPANPDTYRVIAVIRALPWFTNSRPPSPSPPGGGGDGSGPFSPSRFVVLVL